MPDNIICAAIGVVPAKWAYNHCCGPTAHHIGGLYALQPPVGEWRSQSLPHSITATRCKYLPVTSLTDFLGLQVYGSGELSGVQVRDSSRGSIWGNAKNKFGAAWELSKFKSPPFDMRVTSADTGEQLIILCASRYFVMDSIPIGKRPHAKANCAHK